MNDLTKEELINIIGIIVIITIFYYIYNFVTIKDKTSENFESNELQMASNDYPYYKMFKSQIDRPKICECDNESVCNCIQSNEKDLDEMTMKNANKQRCIYQENNIQYMNDYLYNQLSEETKLKDNTKILNNEIATNNINNLATFNNIIEQNSNQIEGACDKIAEIRTSGNETQGFLQYGKNINDIYNNFF